MTTPNEFRSFPELFFWQVDRRGDRTALRFKDLGIWRCVSWREYGAAVRDAAACLVDFGLRPGEAAAILGENRPEWLYCHLGIQTAGGATCGIYPTSAPEQIRYLLGHAEARVLFLENEEQLDKVLPILSETPLELLVVWDRKGLWAFTQERVVFFDDFLKRGRNCLDADPGRLEERTRAVGPEDTAMIIYTSGTTGPPKGAMISHGNILWLAASFVAVHPTREDDEVLSYLPLAHIYENLVSVFRAIRIGHVVNFLESPDTLFENLREISPTYFASVPRIWEKLASTVDLRMRESTLLKRTAYRLAVSIGRRYVGRQGRERPIGFLLGLAYRLAYWTVLYPLKRRLGLDRVRVAVSGAAPASPELFEYYRALGVPLVEGYGQTESTGLIAVNRLERPRAGTVGEPISGIEVSLADDGEILVRGPNVFKGYLKNHELSGETIDAEGWLHTGDIGTWEAGFLKIVDRKKDIIITAGGKNITPAFIENKLKWSPYIQDAVVVGEGRKYLVALIVLDEDNVTKFCQDHRIPFASFGDLAQHPDIIRLIGREVEKVNRTLSRVEAVKRFALLPRRLYEEEGDVTPTKKVKRATLTRRYADLIAALYPD